MSLLTEKEELKALIKESVSELLDQKRDFFAQLIEEVVEDKLFMEALIVGEGSGLVSREAIFDALDHEG